MRRLLVATFVCGLALAPCAAQERLVDTERSTVTVRVFTSGLLRAFAHDHLIQAPLAEGSLDDSETPPHVQIVFDARRLRVLDPRLSARDREEVQARMLGPEVLDVNQFERISFHSLETEPLAAGGWLVRGELALHGQIHPIVVNVFRVVPGDSRYKGEATFRQSDFGIVPASILGGMVKMKDEVKIDFDIRVAGE